MTDPRDICFSPSDVNNYSAPSNSPEEEFCLEG